ncbi:MAG: NADH-quinone oxidoreductase subunit NuoE [Proteobacteria bacterium]|nr:NADH-quinone oxidoreductase subunit NuoE [Pseudomonadota bacterium]
MSAIFKEAKFDQPDYFEFTKENLVKAKKLMEQYPEGKQQAAVMPLLHLAQEQHHNWLPRAAMFYIADMLEMPPIKVFEVAHFYTMYNKQPVGRNLVQVCRTTPCWLRGADALSEVCRNKLGIDMGETTIDGAFTLIEVECLGACVNAPVVQINNDYYEDLSPDDISDILDELAQGDEPRAGSYQARQCSAPVGHAHKGAPAARAPSKRVQKKPALENAKLDFGDESGKDDKKSVRNTKKTRAKK